VIELAPTATYGTVTYHRTRAKDGRTHVRHAYRSVHGIAQTLCGLTVSEAPGDRWHSKRTGLVPSDRALISCQKCRELVPHHVTERAQ
jgi:hypothetical protein